MKLSKSAVKRPVTVAMVFFCIILFGIISLPRLSLDLYPEMNMPAAIVIVSYPGAGPEEVESQLAEPLEEILGTVQSIDSIYSTCTEGQLIVSLMFDWGTDMNYTSMKIREKIDMIKGYLPEDSENPMVMMMDLSMIPVLNIGISGETDLAKLRSLSEDTIKPRLERATGVASVAVNGGYIREIQILPDPNKMAQYGISMDQIKSAVMINNMNLPSGSIIDGSKELNVRTVSVYESVDELRNIIINTPTGASFHLYDIAEVNDTYAEMTSITRLNGKPSVSVVISKESTANTVDTAASVMKELDDLKSELPDNTEVIELFNQADFINTSLNSVSSSAIIGGLLAVIILFFFLRNFMSTLIIAVAIPISILGAVATMYLFGQTLNIMTLGGLALGVGMMVDSSIVILENIFRYREMGYDKVEAAVNGSDEVSRAIIASVITTISVFLPIVFVEGMASMMFTDFAQTVAIVLSVSLVVALTVVPVMSSKFLIYTPSDTYSRENQGRLRRAMSKFGRMLDNLNEKYRKVLGWAINHKKKTIFIVTCAFVVSFVMVPFIGMEFLPKDDMSQISVDIELDKGTTMEKNDEIVSKIEAIVNEVPEVDMVFSSIAAQTIDMGMGGDSSSSQIRVVTVPKSERDRDAFLIADDIRDRLKVVAGAKMSVTVSDMMSMIGTGDPISISIKGKDLKVLKDLSNQVIGIVASVDGTREVSSSLVSGSPEYRIVIDKEKANSLGLSTSGVATSVKTAFAGSVITTFKENGEEYDVRLKLEDKYTRNYNDLENVLLYTASGGQVRLGEIADIVKDRAPEQIDRVDQIRVGTVTASVVGRDIGSVNKDIQNKLDDLKLPEGYEFTAGGETEEMMNAFKDLLLALIVAIILVYMVMAAQFESLVYPFVILFSIPTMLIGVILAQFISGYAFSVPSFIGLIMLAGIVVNNAIVLIDYVNTLRSRGMSREEAILEAGPTRLRPILMTTLTTVLAMLPVAIGFGGEGTVAQVPLAIVVIGGLTVSTIFTLVLVPVMYIIIDKFNEKLKYKMKRLTNRLYGIKEED